MELIKTNQTEFSTEQVDLIKKQIAVGASNDELKLFLYQCQRTGLDPLTRQIYFMKRSGKMTIQTSIDGFRVIAERSGDYAGQDEPVFEEEDGKLIKASVKVYRFRGDTRYCAAVGVAYWAEYVPQGGQDFMWKKMPHTMLAKVAEALALRKAYPQDLSGLYTGDEMEQTEAPAITPKKETKKEVETITEEAPDKAERKLLIDLVYQTDLDEEGQEAAFEAINTCTSYKMYDKIRMRLESRKKPLDQIANPSQKQINEHLKAAI